MKKRGIILPVVLWCGGKVKSQGKSHKILEKLGNLK